MVGILRIYRKAECSRRGPLKSLRMTALGSWLILLTGMAGIVSAQPPSRSVLAPAQGAQKNKSIVISGKFKHFELDRLGNLFLISRDGRQITQYNQQGDSINHYDNVSSYGQITAVDVSNPLKLAVFYKDFATIVVLDRFLSPVNTIDLTKAGIWEPQIIASSYDNQFWVYDKQAARIKKINGQGQQTFASNDLRQVFGDGLNPTRLLDTDGLLYAYDRDLGWYIFDYYGALKQKIPVKGLEDVGVSSGILTARKAVAGKNRLWLMDPDRLGAQPVEENFPDSPPGAGRMLQSLYLGSTGELLLLTESGLHTVFIGKR